MRKVVVGGFFLLLMAIQLNAGDRLALNPDHPDKYVVKKGDTLWDISGMFLRDPWLWPEIWHVNPQIDNPHLIYPGDELNLVYIDGRPKLVVKRGRDVTLSPQMRSSEINRAIPAIPLDVISPFLSRSRVLDGKELESAAYFLSGVDGRIISGAGDQFYARGDMDESRKAYGIFRPGSPYIDPDTEELLGYSATNVGSAQLLDREHDIATMSLNRSSEEVRRGDRLLPEEERIINAFYYPSAPEGDVSGYIISVEGGVAQIGTMDVVVINRGDRNGIKEGNVLAIYRTGEIVRDTVTDDLVKIPDSRAGLLMVFRTFEKVSYGIVLKATRPLSVMDKVKNP